MPVHGGGQGDSNYEGCVPETTKDILPEHSQYKVIFLLLIKRVNITLFVRCGHNMKEVSQVVQCFANSSMWKFQWDPVIHTFCFCSVGCWTWKPDL